MSLTDHLPLPNTPSIAIYPMVRKFVLQASKQPSRVGREKTQATAFFACKMHLLKIMRSPNSDDRYSPIYGCSIGISGTTIPYCTVMFDRCCRRSI